ncbi:MAG: hypothetical protein ILM98_13945 [Kiritimatiellae bacterium]|nr:hypothetical protein [Kiritimatiellia bacterium]
MKKTETDVEWVASYMRASIILSTVMAVAGPCIYFVFDSCDSIVNAEDYRNTSRNERIAELENAEWRDRYAKREADKAWKLDPDSLPRIRQLWGIAYTNALEECDAELARLYEERAEFAKRQGH